MRIEDDIKLDYRDVLIKPKRSTLTSRRDVEIKREFKFRKDFSPFLCPVIAANMSTVGTGAMNEVLSQHSMLTCLHKHITIDEFMLIPNIRYSVLSLGISDKDVEKFNHFYSMRKVHYACIDVANGYTQVFIDFVKRFRDEHPDIVLMAGNVASGEMTEELILSGVDLVKVGIGPGSACTTRVKTGVGVPQLSAVIECSDAAHGLGGFTIADGGITNPGDIAKALGAGADFVMLGGMLAGHDESGGEIIEKDGKKYVEFYGMSSRRANEQFAGGLADYRSSEGRELLIPYKGRVEETVREIEGGIRSACTYTGSRSVKELPKRTTFVRVNNQVNEIYKEHGE